LTALSVPGAWLQGDKLGPPDETGRSMVARLLRSPVGVLVDRRRLGPVLVMLRSHPLLTDLCVASALSAALSATGCETPHTTVVLDNDYPPSDTKPLVVYRAYWQAVSFEDAVAPGSSSDPQSTVPASDNTAYVVLAPGWDPTSATPPTSFVFMQSRSGFGVHLDDTVHIPVDDATFLGNCAAGSFLSQAQADFITERIFTPAIFPDATSSSFHYDAATCTTTPVGGAGPS
jgi:hypothetical protein